MTKEFKHTQEETSTLKERLYDNEIGFAWLTKAVEKRTAIKKLKITLDFTNKGKEKDAK